MRGNRRIDKAAPRALEIGERAFLVLAHQSAIADDIRRQDRRKAPLDALVRHSPFPELRQRRREPSADPHRRDFHRKPRRIVGLDRDFRQRRDAAGGLEPSGEGMPVVKRRSGSSLIMPMMEL